MSAMNGMAHRVTKCVSGSTCLWNPMEFQTTLHGGCSSYHLETACVSTSWENVIRTGTEQDSISCKRHKTESFLAQPDERGGNNLCITGVETLG
jgi:hypothetical protein